MDPITSVGTGLAVLGSKEILTKLLGPTADYLGNEIKGLVDKCNFNLDRIFRIAERKLGDGIDTPEVVNPRVLKNVIDKGRFCEDELMAEYIAGVLASSRTHNGEDDRGVNLLTLLKRLSKFQVRSHYIFYSTFKSVFNNKLNAVLKVKMSASAAKRKGLTCSCIPKSQGKYLDFTIFILLVDKSDYGIVTP